MTCSTPAFTNLINDLCQSVYSIWTRHLLMRIKAIMRMTLSLELFVHVDVYIYILSYQPTQVIKMRIKLANLNDCAVPFLSRAAANLFW